MATYKLTYFDARGRAELSRWVLAVGGVEYHDHRIQREEWPLLKPKTPTGTLPVLTIAEGGNETAYGQSHSIVRFLANKFDLAGKNEKEKFLNDQYYEQVRDFQEEIMKVYFEQDPARKAELGQKLATEAIPKHLKLFENWLTVNGTGFLIGNGVTVSDLFLTLVVDLLGDKRDAALNSFPQLRAHSERIKLLPKLAEWIKKRPNTAI